MDDEFSVRDSLYQWFRKDGYEVKAVENAAEALRAMQDQRYEVVLLDIKMPGMDGMELQEHLHRIDPQAAVIMITAFASVDTAVRALKAGSLRLRHQTRRSGRAEPPGAARGGAAPSERGKRAVARDHR